MKKPTYEELLNENSQLKTALDEIEKSTKAKKKAVGWLAKKGLTVFLGYGLKESIAQTIREFNHKKTVSIDTVSNLGAHIVWRLTRFGFIAIVIGILPTIFLIIQICLLNTQNDKIEQQNQRLIQQTYLQEADRRGSLIFLMSNVMDAIDIELKDTTNLERGLSEQLIGRIVALSHALKPYKFLENDSLSFRISPERGQLFLNLVNANLSKPTIKKIFNEGDFTYSKISNYDFKNLVFDNLDLSYSYITNSKFSHSYFEGVFNLTGAFLDDFVITKSSGGELYLIDTFIIEIILGPIQFDELDFTRSRISDIILNSSSFSALYLEKTDIKRFDIRGNNINDFYFSQINSVEIENEQILEFSSVGELDLRTTSWSIFDGHYRISGDTKTDKFYSANYSSTIEISDNTLTQIPDFLNNKFEFLNITESGLTSHGIRDSLLNEFRNFRIENDERYDYADPSFNWYEHLIEQTPDIEQNKFGYNCREYPEICKSIQEFYGVE